MQERSWTLGVENVDELYEYKNIEVYKNCGSFNDNIDENIEKARKKAGMIFSANIDRRKTNPLIYAKYWKQVCLPSLLFGSEIFSLNPTLLSRLERCQRWFPKILFHLPKFASSILVERLAGVSSVESEIEYRKLLFKFVVNLNGIEVRDSLTRQNSQLLNFLLSLSPLGSVHNYIGLW